MNAIRTPSSGIVHQSEDPELRRHRERQLARHPWLSTVRTVLFVSAAVVAAIVVVRIASDLLG